MGKKLLHGRKVGSGYAEASRTAQFVPGKSGNPKGRGKGVRNLLTEIEEELNARVPITENGTRKTITMRKAVAKRLVNQAASGDHKEISVLVTQARLQESRSAAGPHTEFPLQQLDELVIANIIKRIRAAETPPLESSDEPPTGASLTDTPEPNEGATP